MVGGYQEQVDSPGPGQVEDYLFASRTALDLAIHQGRPRIYLTSEGVRCQELWDFLHIEERGLIEQIMRDYHRAGGNRGIHAPTLAALGLILAGYQDNRQQIAAGVASVQRLLNTVAEFYGIPHFYS